MLQRFVSPLLLIPSFISSVSHGSNKPVSILAKQWKGETLAEKEGAAYVALKFDGFSTEAGANYAPESAEVTLHNVITDQYYLFQQSPDSRFGPPPVFWRLPSGKYEVVRLVAVDLRGQMRFWNGDNLFPKRLIVPRRGVSNFGRWIIMPSKEKELRITYERLDNRYHYEGRDTGAAPVAGVIDGVKGMVQERFDIEKPPSPRSSESDVEVVPQHRSRTIQMFRTVNLMGQNRYAKKMSALLSPLDGEIRDCYRVMLDTNRDDSGGATFAFLLGHEAGRIKKIKFEMGALNDPVFLDCIMEKLKGASLPLEETVLGKLTYTFKVTYE